MRVSLIIDRIDLYCGLRLNPPRYIQFVRN